MNLISIFDRLGHHSRVKDLLYSPEEKDRYEMFQNMNEIAKQQFEYDKKVNMISRYTNKNDEQRVILELYEEIKTLNEAKKKEPRILELSSYLSVEPSEIHLECDTAGYIKMVTDKGEYILATESELADLCKRYTYFTSLLENILPIKKKRKFFQKEEKPKWNNPTWFKTTTGCSDREERKICEILSIKEPSSDKDERLRSMLNEIVEREIGWGRFAVLLLKEMPACGGFFEMAHNIEYLGNPNNSLYHYIKYPIE